MSDGWETRRRRGPGHDWVIVRLGALGSIHRIEVDTSHFKGNAPGTCWLEAIEAIEAAGADVADPAREWQTVLDRTRLQPHTRHVFDDIPPHGEVSHVRFNIHPDGGVARLRLFGRARMAGDA
jgi:allantoicase